MDLFCEQDFIGKEVVEEHPEESVEEVQEKRHALGSGTLPTSQGETP